MNTHPFDRLTLENNATLIFTPCPGTKEESLDASLATLKEAGTSLLITLMFDQEMAKNNALSLPIACENQNITWLQLPISDDAAPDSLFEKQWNTHKKAILTAIENQATIAVHCKGGSGRTGLVIGLILLALGWPKDKIINEVQKLRPKALKHPVQLDYFNAHC